MLSDDSTKPLRIERPKRRAINLEQSLWDYAQTIGSGNASAGIRALLRETRARENAQAGKDSAGT
jgi:hypothetical protein